MITVVCPYCATEVTAPAPEADTGDCTTCGRTFNMAAQLAYERGQAYYQAALEMELAAGRRLKDNSPVLTDILRQYECAYSGLRVACQHDLPPAYYEDTLEMLADIMQRLLKRDMVSTLECSYWTQRIVALKTRHEQATLQQKLEAKEGSFVHRWRWRLRGKQLERALPPLLEKIAEMERAINFTEPPRAARS